MTAAAKEPETTNAGAAPAVSTPTGTGPASAEPSAELLAQAAERGATNAGSAPTPGGGAEGTGVPARFVATFAAVHEQSQGHSAGPAPTGR